MWGWTEAEYPPLLRHLVVPTHVGVDRRLRASTGRPRGCPHGCGGGPCAERAYAQQARLSPRMWGWTVIQTSSTPTPAVVPTHVGVDRGRRAYSARRRRCPHACGGGPMRLTESTSCLSL